MALFKKLFKKTESLKTPKGFHSIEVKSVTQLTATTVKVELIIPVELTRAFSYTAGQYLNFSISIDGKELRRSYSICSGKNEPLAVAVKKIEKGIVSTWFNHVLKAGDLILVAPPAGNFVLKDSDKKIVAIAAGSGITPIMSIAKEIEANDNDLKLFFGNRTKEETLFFNELEGLSKTNVNYFLSNDEKEGFQNGRIDKDSFTTIIKNDLDILKSDAFFLCGPEEMIKVISETLESFGVPSDKIRYELFTAPVLMKEDKEDENHFKGDSQITVILDAEKIEFTLSSDKSILEKVIEEGVDAPYSCKGGVCCSCKAKVLKGEAHMKMNYSLTDKEVEDGYILTCQAEPRSKELLISYDD